VSRWLKAIIKIPFNVTADTYDIRSEQDSAGPNLSQTIHAGKPLSGNHGIRRGNHRILDDAIRELKEKEFRELFAKEEDTAYVGDCQIETDLELLIPDEYVSSIRERLSLYKELDNIKTEEGLMAFQNTLIDRFGPLPGQVSGLMNALRLRWLGGKAGFEKLVMRNGSLMAYFVSSQDSVYYNSGTFRNILAYIQAHPAACRMKETPGRLSLSVRRIPTVDDALLLLRQLLQEE